VLSTISDDLGGLRENINLAADISAQFGIGFTEAASSLQRAFSAGAGAADIFRERGVLAAAGFEAGVSYSIDETRKKLQEYGVSIKGAAQTLSETFTGAVSQAGDRLTLFQAAMGEETLPFFTATLKELVGVFDESGDAAYATARTIGENVVKGFQNAVVGGAYLIDILEAAKNAFLEVVTLGGLLDGAYATIGNALKSLGVSIGESLDGIIDFDKAEAAKNFFDSVGMTADQIKRAKKTGEAITDATKIPKAVSKEIETAAEDTRTAFQKLRDEMDMFNGSTEDYQAFVDRLKELFETGEIGIEDFRNTMRDLDEMFMKNEGLNNFLETLGSAQKALSEDLATAFLEGKNAGDAFKNFFKQMINQIIADIIRLQIIQPILGAIMAPFGFGFGTGGNVVRLPGMAKGGPVMSNKPYVVGERGPEVFVPGRSGDIIPNGAGGGTAVTYNINAVDSQSFQQALAKDPSFVFAVTEAGRRKQPGRI
jgi:transposase